MKLLELTLDSPEENVALDDALLLVDDESDAPNQYLRIWESPTPAVVLGRSSRVHTEVDWNRCQELRIPVVRRSSGGGTVVIGPGCLMYSIVFQHGAGQSLIPVQETHNYVLGKISAALCESGFSVAQAGISDLVTAESPQRKISGNSMRCRRQSILYHGTMLYEFDLRLIEALLRQPLRQPTYRQARGHLAFVTNVNASRDSIVEVLKGLWSPMESTFQWPAKRTGELVEQRFGQTEWTMLR